MESLKAPPACRSFDIAQRRLIAAPTPALPAASATACDSRDVSAMVPRAEATLSSSPRLRVDLASVFESIPAGTSWKQMENDPQFELQHRQLLQMMSARSNDFNRLWGPKGLRRVRSEVSRALMAPSNHLNAEVVNAFDAFVVKVFGAQLGKAYKASEQLDPKNGELKHLREILVDAYVARVALARCQTATPTDWNGKPFQEYPMPSFVAVDAAKHVASTSLKKLRAMDEGCFSEAEKSICERLELKQICNASGVIDEAFLGEDAVLTPGGRLSCAYDMITKYSSKSTDPIYLNRPKAFLEDITLFLLSPDLRRVNVGSVYSAVEFNLNRCIGPDTVGEYIGDPATDAVAKAVTLLAQWYGERLQAQVGDTTERGWGFTDAEREKIWECFQAGQGVPPRRQLTEVQYAEVLSQLKAEGTQHFKQVATEALDALFPPGSVLSSEQRTQVVERIQAQPTFGTLKQANIETFLKEAGNPEAAELFASAIGVPTRVTRELALQTLEALFLFDESSSTEDPDLSRQQRTQVSDLLRAEPGDSVSVDRAVALLHQVSGKDTAGERFKNELAGNVGGYEKGASVRLSDRRRIDGAWSALRSFLSTRRFPRDLGAILQEKLVLTTDSTSQTSNADGRINIDLQSSMPLQELITYLVHEAKHSIDFRGQLNGDVEGADWEGGGIRAEDQVTPLVLEAYYGKEGGLEAKKKVALAKYELLEGQVGFMAMSEAEAAIFTAKPGEDAIQLARDIGATWGLSPEDVDWLIQRVFFNQQYRTYKYGAAQVKNTVDGLQKRVGATSVPLDPFVLQSAGIASARDDEATADVLRAVPGLVLPA